MQLQKVGTPNLPLSKYINTFLCEACVVGRAYEERESVMLVCRVSLRARGVVCFVCPQRRSRAPANLQVFPCLYAWVCLCCTSLLLRVHAHLQTSSCTCARFSVCLWPNPANEQSVRARACPKSCSFFFACACVSGRQRTKNVTEKCGSRTRSPVRVRRAC